MNMIMPEAHVTSGYGLVLHPWLQKTSPDTILKVNIGQPNTNTITYHVFPQTVCLTLGVLTVVVKGRVARSRWRTEFVAIYVLSCLHVHFRRYLRTFRVAAGGVDGFCM